MGARLIDAEQKKWRVAFWYKGKHYTKVVYGQKRTAVEVQAKMRAALAEGNEFPGRRRVPFQEIADAYLREYAAFLKSADKVAIYVNEAAKFFAGRDAESITSDDVRQFRAMLDQRMMPVSTNHYQRGLRRVFNWASERGKFKGQNPASGRKVKFVNEQKYWRTRYLSGQEVASLCAVADEDLADIIKIAVMTGLRKNELRHLRRRDIDLDKNQVFVFEPKNGKPAYVPFPETLFPVLRKLVLRFSDLEAKVLCFVNFDRRWQTVKLKTGIIDVHFHDLRHTYASHVVQNTNGNMKAVKDLLRVSDMRMVERYAHLAPNQLRTAALTLDKTFVSLAEAPAKLATAPEAVVAMTHSRPGEIASAPLSLEEITTAQS